MTTATHEETLGFQTEVKQLLNLMIHSLYSNREIFLRELISNAADACDKLRYAALDNDALYEGDSELRIEIEHDRDANTITLPFYVTFRASPLSLRDCGQRQAVAEAVQEEVASAKDGLISFS